MCLRIFLRLVLPACALAVRFQQPTAGLGLWTRSELAGHDGKPLQELWDGRLAYLEFATPVASDFARRRPKRKTAEKLAICIVGQLARLEVQSKVKNLIEQLEASGEMLVDVYTVLETGPGYFVNRDTDIGGEGCAAAYTPERVKEDLAPWYAGGLFIQHSPGSASMNLENFPRYGRSKPWLNRRERLGLHFQQWTHTASCAELIQQRNSSDGYVGVLKVRDSSIVTIPFRPPVLADRTHIQVKDQQSWGGYNDKVLFAPGHLVEPALTRTLELARQANSGEKTARNRVSKVQNPEQMLAEAWRGLPVSTVSADSLPFVDGRCYENNNTLHYCIVPKWKDSYPSVSFEVKPCNAKQWRH